MTNMRLENKLCNTCKVNRVYDVCDRKHGMLDALITYRQNFIIEVGNRGQKVHPGELPIHQPV